MFTDLRSDDPLGLGTIRDHVVVLPAGSRQQGTAQLWLDWATHTRVCQLRGHEQFTQDCPRFSTIAAFLEAYPWRCCTDHRRLSEERAALITRAEALQAQPAAHQVQGVLTPEWWRWQGGYMYDPRQSVVDRASQRNRR